MSMQAPNIITLADERASAAALFPKPRAAEPAAVTPETIQGVLAYFAEKEQAMGDLRARVAELERLLETDELTGLLNRRGLETAARRALANAQRYREMGVLALIDLDGFKRINDDHGHAAGDAALRLVGRILADNIRATDYAARISGDEFAVVWVRTQAQALQRRIRDLKQTLNTATLDWDGAQIAIKASVGTARFDGTANLEAVMRTADKAMYRHKRIRRV